MSNNAEAAAATATEAPDDGQRLAAPEPTEKADATAVSPKMPSPTADGTVTADTTASTPSASSFTGATLWVFGALLWTYVVMGQYVLRASFPEALAALVVLSALGWSWHRAAGHQRGHSQVSLLGPGVAGLALMLSVLALASVILGSSRRQEVEAVRIGLWMLSVICYFVGRSLTDVPPRAPSKGRRAGAIAGWAIAGLATLGALLLSVSRL